MTVAELIKALEAMPQNARVLTQLYSGDFAGDPAVEPKWARPKDIDPEGWWQVYWGQGAPTNVQGFEEVVTIT